jgi:hypothetical protein
MHQIHPATCVDEQDGLSDGLGEVIVADGKEPTVEDESGLEPRLPREADQGRGAAERVAFLSQNRDRCYDFKNIFANKFGEKMAFFVQNTNSLSKIWIIILFFNYIKTPFFRRKLAKIAEIVIKTSFLTSIS